jgi:hypothetical protein
MTSVTATTSILLWLGLIVGSIVIAGIVGYFVNRNLAAVVVDERGRLSAMHLLLLSWTIIVPTWFAAAVLLNIMNGEARALEVQVSFEVLAVFGITMSSLIIFKVIWHLPISSGRAEQRMIRLAGRARLRDLFFSDLEEDSSTLDIGKVLTLYFGLLVAGTYTAALAVALTDAPGRVHSFPSLPASAVLLVGASEFAYLIRLAFPPVTIEPQQDLCRSKRWSNVLTSPLIPILGYLIAIHLGANELVPEAPNPGMAWQIFIILASLGMAGAAIFQTGFWRNWVFWDRRPDESSLFLLVNTAVVLLVLTEAFAVTVALLYSLGLLHSSKPVQPHKALQTAEAFFSWHFLDSVPAIKIPETLNWRLSSSFKDYWSGGLLLAFKILVIFPVIRLVTELFRQRQNKKSSGED